MLNSSSTTEELSFSSVKRTPPEDPWPQLATQVELQLQELSSRLTRARQHPSSKPLSELSAFIASVSEVVADMRHAFDTAMEHPESFSIGTSEMMKRSESLRGWERAIGQAHDDLEKIVRASNTHQNSAANEAMEANNQFLQGELATQRQITEVDDATLERLHGGIQRVKVTAETIGEELDVQQHILQDVDQGMDRVSVRLESVMKKVGNLLESTSDRGKIILIVVLMVILMLLIGFLL